MEGYGTTGSMSLMIEELPGASQGTMALQGTGQAQHQPAMGALAPLPVTRETQYNFALEQAFGLPVPRWSPFKTWLVEGWSQASWQIHQWQLVLIPAPPPQPAQVGSATMTPEKARAVQLQISMLRENADKDDHAERASRLHVMQLLQAGALDIDTPTMRFLVQHDSKRNGLVSWPSMNVWQYQQRHQRQPSHWPYRLSNQQACGSTPWPDCLTGLTLSFRGFQLQLWVHHYVDCVEYPYQCTLRLWYLETPMTLLQRTGTAPLIDCIRRFSVSDPTRPRR